MSFLLYIFWVCGCFKTFCIRFQHLCSRVFCIKIEVIGISLKTEKSENRNFHSIQLLVAPDVGPNLSHWLMNLLSLLHSFIFPFFRSKCNGFFLFYSPQFPQHSLKMNYQPRISLFLRNGIFTIAFMVNM